MNFYDFAKSNDDFDGYELLSLILMFAARDMNCLAALCMLCSLDMHGRCAVTLYIMPLVCFVVAANKLLKPRRELVHFKP